MIWGSPALARLTGRDRLLASLHRQIHDAPIGEDLKVTLLMLITRVQHELEHRHDTRADHDLHHFIELLRRNAGRHGLSHAYASHWIKTAELIRRTIPLHRHHGHGPANLLPVAHTGISTWVTVDVTGLSVPTGTRLRIDGQDATTAFGYPQPTPANPRVTLLMSVATHRFAWGRYEAKLDVYWRGYPYTGRGDYYKQVDTEYFGGVWPNVADAPGGIDNTAAFQNWSALNNGYSVVPDPAGATSCVFAVAPGDQPYVTGVSMTRDTRAELNLTEDYSAARGIPGSPPGGIDAFGNTSRTVRFWRLDYLFPQTWIAPALVQNTAGAWAAPPYGSGRGRWQLPPAAQGGPTPTHVITNTAAAIETISNVTETGGPAVIVWGVTNGGKEVCWRFSPVALGKHLGTLLIDTHAYSFDIRENTILEYCPQLYCTGASGRPIHTYGVPSGGPPYRGGYFRTWRLIGEVWECTSAGHPYAVPGTATIIDGAIVGSRLDAGKIFGPTLKSNALGGLIEGLVATPGINAAQDLPTPVCVREWPLLIGPTFASVSGPPAA